MRTANDIAVLMAQSPLWYAVSPFDAQRLANVGRVVVGTYFNPNSRGHGHVVTVRPSDDSGFDPRLANVGRVNGVIPASELLVPLVYYTGVLFPMTFRPR